VSGTLTILALGCALPSRTAYGLAPRRRSCGRRQSRFQSQTQHIAAILDALFEFGLLELLLGQSSIFAFGNSESFDRAPAFGHGGESEELFRADVTIKFPEIVFMKRERANRAGNDFELDAHAGANCGEAVEIFWPINLPFAHRRPCHRRAFARLPD